MTDLLIADSEFALRFFVRLRVAVEFLHCLVIFSNGLCEFDVALRVFVPRENLGIVWQRGEGLVQCLVHFLGRALEEAPASANEHCVTCENGLVLTVLEVEANAVLCVAWGVESGHLDGADVECLLV